MTNAGSKLNVLATLIIVAVILLTRDSGRLS
jgi:hypothetical protein